MMRVFKTSAVLCGACVLGWLTACGPSPDPHGSSSDDEMAMEPVRDERPVILFLGDSLTAGYRLDPEQAYPALIQAELDERGIAYRAVNAGVSGETSTDGLGRLDWLLRQPVEVLVLALGANDGLRGLPVDLIRGNLDQIFRRTRERYPDARLVLAGMQMPVNFGPDYTAAFQSMYTDLAADWDAVLIPFLLEEVAGRAVLNLEDGIHPNAQGHAVLARTVWSHLKPLLE